MYPKYKEFSGTLSLHQVVNNRSLFQVFMYDVNITRTLAMSQFDDDLQMTSVKTLSSTPATHLDPSVPPPPEQAFIDLLWSSKK
jgi:hypothetical protein